MSTAHLFGSPDHPSSRSGAFFLLPLFALISFCSFFSCIAIVTLAPRPASGQDWGTGYEDDWSVPPAAASPSKDAASTGWSVRAGIGFTVDPGTLHLNFEIPYALDPWVSIGPMIQVGLDEHDTIVAPTANITVTVPDLPGESFDRWRPFGMVGIGFAVIEDDNRRGDNSSAGLLLNVGFGLEYQVSDHLFFGSQMMFNFLPVETLDEKFFYSWQVGGLRLAF